MSERLITFTKQEILRLPEKLAEHDYKNQWFRTLIRNKRMPEKEVKAIKIGNVFITTGHTLDSRQMLFISALFGDTTERVAIHEANGIPGMFYFDLDDFKDAIGRIEARSSHLFQKQQTQKQKVI